MAAVGVGHTQSAILVQAERKAFVAHSTPGSGNHFVEAEVTDHEHGYEWEGEQGVIEIRTEKWLVHDELRLESPSQESILLYSMGLSTGSRRAFRLFGNEKSAPERRLETSGESAQLQ
jgi:hypothetical protein